jgi:dolichol-phosphate mannosyltransferase
MAGDGSATGDSVAPTLSIVLAVLNERPSLPELFARLRATDLPPWEAIVVDDGSTDGSREFVRSLADGDRRVRLIEHDGRQTTLAAQCSAVEAARGRYVAVMDADLQHPPELLRPLVRQLEQGAALAVASRYLPGGTPGPRPPLRAVISRGAEWTAKLFLAPARRLTDPVSGYFAFRRSAFVPLPAGQRGYKLLLFLLVMTRRLEVREVAFRFEPRTEGASKVTSGLAFVRLFLVEVILARRLARTLARPSPEPPVPSVA